MLEESLRIGKEAEERFGATATEKDRMMNLVAVGYLGAMALPRVGTARLPTTGAPAASALDFGACLSEAVLTTCVDLYDHKRHLLWEFETIHVPVFSQGAQVFLLLAIFGNSMAKN